MRYLVSPVSIFLYQDMHQKNRGDRWKNVWRNQMCAVARPGDEPSNVFNGDSPRFSPKENPAEEDDRKG